MRLIDVRVLKEWVENWFTKNRFYHPYAKNNNIPITELYDILELIPSADAVEVVRCADCKHSYETFAGWICSHGTCVDCVVRDDFYCAYGERNEAH